MHHSAEFGHLIEGKYRVGALKSSFVKEFDTGLETETETEARKTEGGDDEAGRSRSNSRAYVRTCGHIIRAAKA
jgi:hypothetical protein